ncbi:MAG: MaoC family dehydratase N-terminal domain-containing protein, partial [Acidimicrobiia bacterium]|nr:MaoC family dehydratase N-terminal domain-containing protein [Acidimicrobiia bacterium]
MTTTDAPMVLDTSEVDRRVGQRLGGGQLREPVSSTDIRRWVQGMQYPNPIHFDEDAARQGPFGRIVAPQSFAVCADTGHGATPAIVGSIPGTHMIFGGDEWWFYGPRVYPGDQLRSRRRFVDYKVADTKFAGPTCFQRGDTLYINQSGERVGLQRSTSIRYRVKEAKENK